MNTETKQAVSVDLDKLKSALDNSSDKNRNYLVAFLVLELYLLITVLGITDSDLFLTDSQLNLPFIAVDIPLVGFFVLAPLLLTAFFYNLLFNLLEHARTLREWLDHPDNNRQQNFNLLNAFMLNTRAKYDAYEPFGKNKGQPRALNYHLLNIIIIGIMSIFPLFLLVLIMWKFADYQSYAVTIWHSILILACIFLHVVYWLRIQNPSLLLKKDDSFVTLLKNLKHCRIECIYLSIALFLVILRLFALGATNFSELRHYMDNPIVNLLVPHLNVSNRFFPKNTEESGHNDSFMRQLYSPNDIYLKTKPSTDDIQRYIKQSTAEDDWEKICANSKDTGRVNLEGRVLRFAKLDNSTLCRVRMLDTDLRGASLNNAVLSGDFTNTNLEFATVRNTRFSRGSVLYGAIFDNADLTFAVLRNVNLTLASAKNANFLGTQLADATMAQITLSGARFSRANLLRANMRSANLTNTSFSHTPLIGIDFRFVTGLLAEKQLIESPILFCFADTAVVWPISLPFSQANCEIQESFQDSSPFKRPINRLMRYWNFDYTMFEQIHPKWKSKVSLVENIIQITHLNEYKSLDLSGYGLSNIPSGVLVLTQLEELNLSRNKLTFDQIDLLFTHLPQLKKLNLSSNYLANLPISINRLTELTTLNLSFNDFTELPASVGQLPKLKELNVSLNDLIILDESIGNLGTLQSINLANNNLERLPESMSNLKRLQTLNIESNKFKALPTVIKNLSKLTTLKLGYNSLSDTPDFISGLNNLTSLKLGGQQIEKMTASICRLSTAKPNLEIDLDSYIKELQDPYRVSYFSPLDTTYDKTKQFPITVDHICN